MTDKELKKLSRLELLELLLTETRENEKLREELAKAKKENSIEKSAKILNETARQLDEALQKVSQITDTVGKTQKKGKASGKKPEILNVFSKEKISSLSGLFNKNNRQNKSKK